MTDLPDGWALASLSEIFELNPRKPLSDALPSATSVSFVPMASVDADSGAITQTLTREFSAVRGGYTAFRDGDVILAKITPCFENGKVAIARGMVNGLGFGSSEFHVLRPTGAVNADYAFHYLRQRSFRQEGAGHMTGTAGQARVPVDYLKRVGIPFPPLPEQVRIVTRIDELLARVSSARDHLARVSDIVKRFRRAVLVAACTGRLTKDWRVLHGIRTEGARSQTLGALEDLGGLFKLPSDWCWGRLGQVIEDIEAGRSFTCEERTPRDNEVGVLKVSSVTWGRYDEGESKTCTDPQRIDRALFVRPGDFLFSRANTIELVGAAVIAKEVRKQVMLSDKILRLNFRDRGIVPEWILWALRSPHGRDEIERLATGNQQSMRNIGQGRICQIRLPFPPYDEQCEIAVRVGALMRVADSVEHQVSLVSVRSGAITESTLAKAFRGDLVPTEAELAAQEGRPFESAADLLERVRKR